MEKYHYTQSGLDNVWLVNGFAIQDSPYGRGVAIENVEGLHAAIADALVRKPGQLTGKEFRYLRKQLDLSQARIGELMGKGAQAVAKWEKADQVPTATGFLVRHIYKQALNGRQTYVDLIDELKQLDYDLYSGELAFQETKEGWKKAS
jgi:DNA-binding transcriptional regulator YiaG